MNKFMDRVETFLLNCLDETTNFLKRSVAISAHQMWLPGTPIVVLPKDKDLSNLSVTETFNLQLLPANTAIIAHDGQILTQSPKAVQTVYGKYKKR